MHFFLIDELEFIIRIYMILFTAVNSNYKIQIWKALS